MNRKSFIKNLMLLSSGMFIPSFKLLASTSNYYQLELDLREFDVVSQLASFANNIGASKNNNGYVHGNTLFSVFFAKMNGGNAEIGMIRIGGELPDLTISSNGKKSNFELNGNKVAQNFELARFCDKIAQRDIVNVNNIHLAAMTSLSDNFRVNGGAMKAVVRTLPDVNKPQYVDHGKSSFSNQIGAKDGKVNIDYKKTGSNTGKIKIVSEKWTGFDKDRKEGEIYIKT